MYHLIVVASFFSSFQILPGSFDSNLDLFIIVVEN